jgi:uncharacterized protein
MIDPNMGSPAKNLSSMLFGRVRSAVISLLFCNSHKSFYFREIERIAGMGRGAVQRELENLVNVGLVFRRKQGNQVYYQANPGSPIFAELKSLMVKTTGIADVLREAMTPLRERIKAAFIYGSFAKGTDTADSDVDVLVLGELEFSEVVDALAKAQESIGREVNPSVYPVDEFMTKLSSGRHFVTSLVGEPKIFLFGDEDVFGRLDEKRLVGSA